jgi:hypothetical protein
LWETATSLNAASHTEAPGFRGPIRAGLPRDRLLQFSAEKFEDLLLALLYFEQNRFRHSSIVLPRMDLARLQKDSQQIGYALLREQHLVVGLNHASLNSTILRFRKFLEI